MDITKCFHQWMLGMALFVLLHQCQEATGSRWGCPQGQIMQGHYDYRVVYITCCYPTRCGVGKEVKPCTRNGTTDTCQECNQHHNQSRRTSSFTMDRCVPWPLDANCRTDNDLKPNDPRTKRCLCNVEDGLKYDLPESQSPGAPSDAFCQPMSHSCQPGYEPTVDGFCKPCDEHYFKPDQGFKLCEPKTNCTMLGLDFDIRSDSTSDNECSKIVPVTIPPPPVITAKPYKPETPSKSGENQHQTTVSTTTTLGSDDPRAGPSKGTEHSKDSEDKLIWPFIVAALFVLTVFAALFGVMLCRKRQGLTMCGSCCCDTEKAVSPSLAISMTSRGESGPKGPPMANGVIEPHLGHQRDKTLNNNINGGIHLPPSSIVALQSDSGVSSSYSPLPSEYMDRRGYLQGQANPQHMPAPRAGILRNGTGQHPRNNYLAHGGIAAAAPRDISMDSIGHEKLRVKIANPDLGEEEPLLLADNQGSTPSSAAGSERAFHTHLTYSPSPPVHPAIQAPPCLIPASTVTATMGLGPGNNPTFVASPAVNQPKVTFMSSQGAVTFTRSTSVITNPEGEREEEELEAIVPRFSQLLSGEDTQQPAAEVPNRILQMLNECELPRAVSPARELTHELRNPADRLLFQPQPDTPAHPNKYLERPRGNSARPQLHRASSAPGDESSPEHCIMDLKEQQLAESRSASLDESSSIDTRVKHTLDSSLNTRLKNTMDSSLETHVKTVDDSESTEPMKVAHRDFRNQESEQTELKTQLNPDKKKDPNRSSPGANSSNPQRRDLKQNIEEPDKFTKVQKEEVDVMNWNTTERKQLPSGGGLGKDNSERKRAPSGGSAQGTLERRRAPSGEHQKSCLKSASSEEGVNSGKRQGLGRTVSFETEENKGGPTHGHITDSIVPKETDSSGVLDNGVQRGRAAQRLISDTEKRKGQRGREGQETELKGLSTEDTGSSSSPNRAAASGSESNSSCNSSPSRAYLRSQSESTPSSESLHKPPIRSASEDKQKMERPIATVKPMPASNSSVNSELDGATPLQTAQNTPVVTNILQYSSDESEDELSDNIQDTRPKTPETVDARSALNSRASSQRGREEENESSEEENEEV